MTLPQVVLLTLVLQDPAKTIWRDPGQIERVDFAAAAGGVTIAPKAPFHYQGEPSGGASAKILVTDSAGLEWRVKAGPEARADSFCTRFAAALGYFSEVTWFRAEAGVEGFDARRRPRIIDSRGRATWVSFELREPNTRFAPEGWTWTESPFAGTPELNGLKILVMLLSNWDNKDARDARRGSNVGVWDREEDGRRVRAYFVNDWGQSMGGWKTRWGNGTAWDCRTYSSESANFASLGADSRVRFGYRGQHTADFSSGITRDDVRWFMKYAGRITDAQINTGLLVSGASKEEQTCFSAALRKRLEQLRRIAQE